MRTQSLKKGSLFFVLLLFAVFGHQFCICCISEAMKISGWYIFCFVGLNPFRRLLLKEEFLNRVNLFRRFSFMTGNSMTNYVF